MRKELEPFENQKINLKGTIERFGLKSAYRGGDLPTLLLKDIKLSTKSGNMTIDHLWINVGKTIAHVNPRIGNSISFSAWVRGYFKGYFNPRQGELGEGFELGINRISAIRTIETGDGKQFKDFWLLIKASGKFVTKKLDSVIKN